MTTTRVLFRLYSYFSVGPVFLRRILAGSTGKIIKEALPVDALKVAHWILAFSQEHGDPLTNLKLQKLLYYAQAWHLALYDKPLFRDPIEAWIYGPVVPMVYRQFKKFRNHPVLYEGEKPTIPEKVGDFLEELLEVFGGYSSYQLERMTHSEKPWQKARGNLPIDVQSRAVILHEDMKAFYRVLAEASCRESGTLNRAGKNNRTPYARICPQSLRI